MSKSKHYFRLEERNGRKWFIAPEGHLFFSLGLNHFDSTTLRYPESIHVWRDKYGNSQERWIKESVATDLRRWGFNTIGYVHDIVWRGRTMLKNSTHWTYEEFQWADLPYCCTLKFSSFDWQDIESNYPDVFSQDFEAWCDYLAREVCGRMADDPKLLGYFYADCPTWTFARAPAVKGPYFDPSLLERAECRKELRQKAEKFYRTTHDAIRRYDPNHLILGDRYEGRRHLADEVVLAAAPFVDLLSFQHFGPPEQVTSDLTRWHKLTGKPVLLADACAPDRDMSRYPDAMRQIRSLPSCVGWHYCGAYLANRVRTFGLRDERDHENTDITEVIRQVNQETEEWVRAQID